MNTWVTIHEHPFTWHAWILNRPLHKFKVWSYDKSVQMYVDPYNIFTRYTHNVHTHDTHTRQHTRHTHTQTTHTHTHTTHTSTNTDTRHSHTRHNTNIYTHEHTWHWITHIAHTWHTHITHDTHIDITCHTHSDTWTVWKLIILFAFCSQRWLFFESWRDIDWDFFWFDCGDCLAWRWD